MEVTWMASTDLTMDDCFIRKADPMEFSEVKYQRTITTGRSRGDISFWYRSFDNYTVTVLTLHFFPCLKIALMLS